MINENFIIRPMKRNEIDIALQWAAAEGWNPGLYDGECFYETSHRGFLLGELNGQPIGCISAVDYDDNFAFLGLYIVKPEFRGQGFGIQLWQAAINHCGWRNIGLDGVIAQQENYKKSGFNFAYHHLRYEGIGGGTIPSEITPLSDIPFDELVAYDRPLFPAERANFLHCWLQQPDSHALGVIEGGKLVGYGMIRQGHQGCRIGPLFANSIQIAETLLQGLLAKVPNMSVFIDVPDINPEGIALVESYNMNAVFGTARMYTKETPSLPMQQIFGVTTLELG